MLHSYREVLIAHCIGLGVTEKELHGTVALSASVSRIQTRANGKSGRENVYDAPQVRTNAERSYEKAL